MDTITIEQLPHHHGSIVTVNGWITGVRSSGKIAFLQLRDGSGFVQVVAPQADLDDATFDLARHLRQETAVAIRGQVREDPRSPTGVELGLHALRVLAPADNYPISPKEHGVDFLQEVRHLHLRHRQPWAIMRIRDDLIRGIHDFLGDRGFVKFDAPFFTPNAAEGTTTLFEIDISEETTVYLSQSGQLYAEAGAMALGKVYTFGPTFRAEKSKTRKHLLEFWMVEPEVAFLDHEGNVALQEEMLTYLVGRVLERRAYELELLGRDPTALEPAAQGGYPRMTYDEALELLADAGLSLDWGEDFGAPHEAALSEPFDRPVFIEAWPAQTKAFYMEPVAGDPSRVKCDDLIAPDGYGELIGGSQRIHDPELLARRIEEHGLPADAYAWYLDLRRYGSVPHSGFGLGLERTLAWLTGVHHLREVIPFPRTLTRLEP